MIRIRRLLEWLSARPLLCRLGRHDVLRCAGDDTHRWTWTGNSWTAELTPGRAWTSPFAPPGPPRPTSGRVLPPDLAARLDEVIAHGDVDGYLELLRETDRTTDGGPRHAR